MFGRKQREPVSLFFSYRGRMRDFRGKRCKTMHHIRGVLHRAPPGSGAVDGSG